MRDTVLQLFNTAQTKTYTFDQVQISDPLPVAGNDDYNTTVTVSTLRSFNETEQWSVSFGYNRLNIDAIAAAHPTLTVSKQAVWLSDALKEMRAQWDLTVNPEDFNDVQLPTGAGTVSITASLTSIGLIGGGIFTVARS